MKSIAIIGGGPAALMLAAELDPEKYQVDIYEKKKAVGRKFLVAGEGGLNLTFSAPTEKFIAQYHPTQLMVDALQVFNSKDLMDWLKDLGIVTFIGSSQRVFPDQELKPVDVLNRITKYIASKNVTTHLNSQWLGWSENDNLLLSSQGEINADIVVFALGGASWKVTGSDGCWGEKFTQKGIQVETFRAANCGFEVQWDKKFITQYEGKPLKNIALSIGEIRSTGELVISKLGIEGNAIYPLSRNIQDQLLSNKTTDVLIDLKPTLTVEQILNKLSNSKYSKITDKLSKDLKLDRTAIALLKVLTDRDTFLNSGLLAEKIKSLPITLHGADKLDKAISTLGGIALSEIDKSFQLKKIPNSYVIGEMVDWYAPTGGYLLQGCFSMGFSLAKHLNALDK